MTSCVAGDEAIFEENFVSLTLFRRNKKHQKLAKCLVMSYSTCQASKMFNFRPFLIVANFGQNANGGQYGSHFGGRDRPPAAAQPLIYTPYC